MVLKYDNSIEVWKLGSGAPPNLHYDSSPYHPTELERKPIELLKVTEEPIKIFEIKCNEVESIHNATVSADAQFLAYCSRNKLKLLKLDMNQPKIEKLSINVKTVPHLLKFRYVWF